MCGCQNSKEKKYFICTSKLFKLKLRGFSIFTRIFTTSLLEKVIEVFYELTIYFSMLKGGIDMLFILSAFSIIAYFLFKSNRFNYTPKGRLIYRISLIYLIAGFILACMYLLLFIFI